ncbi:ribosome hibernation-promoting factor, HPF/YfiA family [Ochrovirga pacifica]|uniref:ribosome hibernation-promoting factor, HPF/YfiA family n=1 Tax=Ochrovirga pacifica TaxID=1042376 RepID=UPI0002558AD1|nr:ribosome-associated translation inhibitor RaiA [Ochrovirga pacifica]
MKVNIQSVNFTADKDLVNFVQKKVAGLEKFHDKIVDAEVFLKVKQTSEKENKVTELKLNVPNHDLMVKKEAKTFEEGISLCVDSMRRQVMKTKEKERELQQ